MWQWWRNLISAGQVPGPVAPFRTDERWSRPISFTLNVPDEITGWVGGPDRLAPRVSRASALSVASVKRGRDLICGTLGTLRLKEHDDGRRTVRSELLEQPESDVARSVSMTMTFEDMLFEGRAWWRVVDFTADGFPAKVVRLEPRSVTVRETGRVYVNQSGQAQGMAWEFVPDAELIRIDCPNEALLTAGARVIRAALALEGTAAKYADDPMPQGYFSTQDGVDPGDDDQVEQILDNFDDARSRRVWPYIGGGLQPHQLQWNPEQLQLSSARDYAVLEISRLMGVDPEELGVSTTSRTYANAEQRRLDLIDFTCAAYVCAVEDRLSMPDVTQPGHYVRAEYGGFLRSDTLTRMQTYETGRRVGVYNDQRIAELEDIPSAKPQAPPAAAVPPAPPNAPAPPSREDKTMQSTRVPASAVDFAAPTDPDRQVDVGFVMDPSVAEFKVDGAKRTVAGTVIPWNTVAYSRGAKWSFAPGSLHWSDESRVKLDKDHGYGTEFGKAVTLTNGAAGLSGSFKVGRGHDGDQALMLAEDGVYDGFSASVTFESDADGWTAHPDDDSVRLVHSATLRKVALTAMPAFDDARVATVNARREDNIMTAPAAPPAATTTAPAEPANAPSNLDLEQFTAGLTTAVTAAVAEAFARLPQPQRQIVPAGRVQVTREAPVYLMNGHGHSLVRDTWKARTEGDHEAAERLRKFSQQTQETAVAAMNPEFVVSTGNASQVVPPGYRPDMYVTQLMQGRPLVDSVSRGTLSDATPFNIPSFVSATGATAQHVEGNNPTGGALTLGVITVTPTAISGLFELTREIVDSANPAIDAIAMAAMQESYAQQSEALVYGQVNGATGVGGVITSGFVPSGAQAATTTGQGDELLAGVRSALALYPFRRFGAANRAHISQEATSAFASAVDTTGRPLLPYIGATNSVGTANTVAQGYQIDGLVFQPTWSMTGNAAGDADVLVFNAADVWAWESALLMFRFEERNGPARIDLALFGYFATRVLRPVGLSGIRHTAA